MSRTAWVRSLVVLGITSLPLLAGCGGMGPAVSNQPPADPLAGITVSISPATAPVEVGFSQQFNATVGNDPANKGGQLECLGWRRRWLHSDELRHHRLDRKIHGADDRS
jgi:hypothetical protein